jgi:hypothetical protein
MRLHRTGIFGMSGCLFARRNRMPRGVRSRGGNWLVEATKLKFLYSLVGCFDLLQYLSHLRERRLTIVAVSHIPRRVVPDVHAS